MAFWSLSRYLDMEWMKEAYRRTRKNRAAGVDGQTAEEFSADLEGNLRDLLDRAKEGTYRAPAVRRVHIPKGDKGTETRPIGIPTFGDAVLQRAILMLLEPIYEQDFLNCSYGFRPGRSQHQALQAFWKQMSDMGGGTVIELDIRKYFDTVGHGRVQELLRQRVRDGVVERLIGKWLNAGVLDEGHLAYPETGVPQGGVISPLFSNVYLHEILDTWFERTVKPLLKGRAFVVRFADDAVLGFEYQADARRVMKVLPKRFEKYELKLHPEKTKMVPFQRPGRRPEVKPTERSEGPSTFDLLGFTHYWGLSRKGNWIIRRKTASGRFTRAVKKITAYCKSVRHQRLKDQYEGLKQKLTGHYQYYGITGNSRSLGQYAYEVRRIWKRWLMRRSQRRKKGGWERFSRTEEQFPLPMPRVVHSIYNRVANP